MTPDTWVWVCLAGFRFASGPRLLFPPSLSFSVSLPFTPFFSLPCRRRLARIVSSTDHGLGRVAWLFFFSLLFAPSPTGKIVMLHGDPINLD